MCCCETGLSPASFKFRESFFRFIDQCDMIAKRFNRLHPVRGKWWCSLFAFNSRIFSVMSCAFTGSNPEKGSSKIISLGSCSTVADELHLLRHPLRCIFHLLAPPILDLKFLQTNILFWPAHLSGSNLSIARDKEVDAPPNLFIKAALFAAGSNDFNVFGTERHSKFSPRPDHGLMIWLMIRMSVVCPRHWYSRP